MENFYKVAEETYLLNRFVFEHANQEFNENLKVFAMEYAYRQTDSKLIAEFNEILERVKEYERKFQQEIENEDYLKKIMEISEIFECFQMELEKKMNLLEKFREVNRLNSKIVGIEVFDFGDKFKIVLGDKNEIVFLKNFKSDICISLPETWVGLEHLKKSGDLGFILDELKRQGLLNNWN
jgi:hypothetical protein